MIHELSTTEFNETFVMPMRRLGEDECYRPIPLGAYLSECIAALDLSIAVEDVEIHHVYLSGEKRFTHVMCFFGEPDIYLVVVVDHGRNAVLGYHVLDINALY